MPSPQTITEAATWDTPLTALGGGENVDPTNMLRDFQKVANRLKYLGDRIGIGGSPAVGVKQFADIAALKAVNPGSAGYLDGDVVWILGTQHLGAYRYNSGSSATEDRPWLIAPTAGSGRWFHEWYDLRPRNVTLTDTTLREVSSTSFADFPSLSTTIAGGITGDILEVECWALIADKGLAGAQTTTVKLVAVDGASSVIDLCADPDFNTTSTSGVKVISVGRTVLAADGTVTLKLQGKTTSIASSNMAQCSKFFLRARLVKDQA